MMTSLQIIECIDHGSISYDRMMHAHDSISIPQDSASTFGYGNDKNPWWEEAKGGGKLSYHKEDCIKKLSNVNALRASSCERIEPSSPSPVLSALLQQRSFPYTITLINWLNRFNSYYPNNQ